MKREIVKELSIGSENDEIFLPGQVGPKGFNPPTTNF